MLPAGVFPDRLTERLAGDERVAIAVLGDSDSQGYRDMTWNPPPARGGAYRNITLQWTESLARLRADQIDLGDVDWWGARGKIAHALSWIGVSRRIPRKYDHQYNFAFGGASSRDLIEGVNCQAPQLLALMNRDPQRWRRGAVIIRIGIIDLGGDTILRQMAKDPDAPSVTRTIATCSSRIAKAIDMIQARHPETRFMIVGVINNSDCPPNSERPMPLADLANTERALDRFDNAMRELAARDQRITFFDDRSWFRSRWGGRSPDGKPNYKPYQMGDSICVTHASGDAPSNSVLADKHAGLVLNTLWSQSVSNVLAAEMALAIDPIQDDEVVRFLIAQCAAKH